MRTGDLEWRLVSDGTFCLDGGAMFGVVPKPLWERKSPPDSWNRITLGLNALLVESDGKKILVDAGMGRKEDERFAEIRDGERVPVLLSELFEDPAKPLLLMHFMFGKAQSQPCPMCTAWADGYDGVLPHLRQRVNFAVFCAGDPAVLEAWGRERGWRNVRVVSAADSELKRHLALFVTAFGGRGGGTRAPFAKPRAQGVDHFALRNRERYLALERFVDVFVRELATRVEPHAHRF